MKLSTRITKRLARQGLIVYEPGSIEVTQRIIEEELRKEESAQ